MVKFLLEVGKWGTISTETLTECLPRWYLKQQRSCDRRLVSVRID
ncbi:hypothetical protein [Methanosarcina sp. UBA5]|nr:hypothetical protein [Methanosarcina sp. UBA5]